MKLSFNEIEQIRAGILDYSKRFSEDELFNQNVSTLVPVLKQYSGKEMSIEDLSSIFYDEMFIDNFAEHKLKSSSVFAVYTSIMQENTFLEGLEKLLGKTVSNMDNNELMDNSMKLFTLTSNDYTNLMRQKGLPPDEKFDNYIYCMLLTGVLKARDVNFGVKEIRSKILDSNNNLGLGYLEREFKWRLDFVTGEKMSDGSLWDLNCNFHRELSRTKTNLENHLLIDKQLKERHTISTPILLADKTLNLDIVPYAIDFTSDNKLVLLGGEINSKNEFAYSHMILNIYDIDKGLLLNSTNTKIPSQFGGTLGMIMDFDGSLVVGQDNVIYVNGTKRFSSSNLAELTDNESKYIDVINLLKNKDILTSYNEIFQTNFNDGIFYFAIQPNYEPKCYDNILIASNGKEIIGSQLRYSPNGGASNANFNSNPRIAIFNNDIYFKHARKIFSMDKSFTEKAHTNARLMIGNDEYSAAIPSNHCVSSQGVLYAVNKLSSEVAQSIQGYVRGQRYGELATHIYPEDPCEGGYASLRSMAISSNNILAYTSLAGNKVHFYKLDK